MANILTKKVFVIVIIVISISISVCFYLSQKFTQDIIEQQVSHSPCLGEDEVAEYEIIEKNRGLGDTEADIIISIRDKKNDFIKHIFKINNLFNNHSFEIHKCGVYVLRMFNYNSQKIKQDTGYKDELWKYDYTGNGKSIMLFAEKPGEFISYYSSVFRIDFIEAYIVLLRGHLSREDYAIVIKELKSLTNSFELLRKDLFEKYPDLIGYFGLESWTKDGAYFWGDLAIGANEIAFLRIARDTWDIDVLPAPQDVLGGDALNIENGWITVHPGNVWFGIAEMTEAEKAKRRSQDIGTELYIHNLFTQERQFVDKTDEPLWFFKPKWISDTELEYEMPNGERRIYRIID